MTLLDPARLATSPATTTWLLYRLDGSLPWKLRWSPADTQTTKATAFQQVGDFQDSGEALLAALLLERLQHADRETNLLDHAFNIEQGWHRSNERWITNGSDRAIIRLQIDHSAGDEIDADMVGTLSRFSFRGIETPICRLHHQGDQPTFAPWATDRNSVRNAFALVLASLTTSREWSRTSRFPGYRSPIKADQVFRGSTFPASFLALYHEWVEGILSA